MKRIPLLLTFFLLTFQYSISQNIPSPAEILGYEIGEQFTRHADIVEYFEEVAKASPLVNYYTYGKTNERRPLTYAVISSEENLQNIDQIRQDHLKSAGLMEGEATSDKAIVWLSYNVHGNEASSTEAAMKTLFELITQRQELLENTVVIIDPCVNPDGRDRYVNWYNQVKAEPYDISQAAAEHHEPWPGGRPNHYLFDLNRDWAWATQVETRERLKVYNEWMPHIHVDFHEQGINDPYYFAPAAEPFHEVITPFQKEFQTEIGKNSAKYFDEKGWLYFTGERFDLLYPSYGDTYPTYMGAIGMTFEQAGHGRAGLGIQTDEGYLLTLKDRVAHHFTTGMSTIEVAAANAGKLNSEFSKYFNSENFNYKSYALSGSRDKINAVKKLLDKHELTYEAVPSGERIRGFDYKKNASGNFEAGEASLLVNTDQPKGKMVKVLMEPQTKLTDSLTYDITAWSIPYAYGLDAVASTEKIGGEPLTTAPQISNTTHPEGAGYIAKWKSMEDARFLASLLKAGIKVRFTEVPFQSNGQKFDRGSLIITKSDNFSRENFDRKVVELANEYQRQLLPATTSFAQSGPDFGSADIKLINKQNVGLLKGDGISSLNYGEIWYFFEQELNYPVTSLDTRYFEDLDLDRLDVLILPEGSYSDVLKDPTLKKMKEWISEGGKLIAIGSAMDAFAGKDGFDLKKNEQETTSDSIKTGNLTPYNKRERQDLKNLITGSIIKTKVDDTHPMAFGYEDTYFSLKLSGDSYQFLEDGYNVAYIGEPEVIAGFAGSEAVKNLRNSLVFGEERMGNGSVIYLADNPLFRAFWQNGRLFFVNSIFFVNNNKIRI